MSKSKCVPMRTCIACRELKPKKEMTRVVRNADGDVFADPTGKASGRGAYICNATECRNKLADKKLLNKAFRTAIDGAVYEAVCQQTTEQL